MAKYLERCDLGEKILEPLRKKREMTNPDLVARLSKTWNTSHSGVKAIVGTNLLYGVYWAQVENRFHRRSMSGDGSTIGAKLCQRMYDYLTVRGFGRQKCDEIFTSLKSVCKYASLPEELQMYESLDSAQL